jgi:hypothetical protein
MCCLLQFPASFKEIVFPLSFGLPRSQTVGRLPAVDDIDFERVMEVTGWMPNQLIHGQVQWGFSDVRIHVTDPRQ